MVKMSSNDEVNIDLLDSQALIRVINANVTYCAWPRGSGKTTRGIGPQIQHLSEVMPRSQVLLFSDTYERLFDRIVPNIVHFLQSKLYLVEGVDFVLFKKPPDHWTKPLIPLTKFDKVISFSSGMALCLVSLSVEGSANAFNAQAAIGDEVKFCDEEKIDAEVLPALRGAEEYFGHLPEYLSVWMFTDKHGPKIKWYLRKKKLVNQKAVETVYNLQMKIFELEKEMQNYTSTRSIYQYKNLINLYKEKADRIRKYLVYYSDMKPYENLKSLGKFFFDRARRIAKSLYVFNVAYLNHDPDKIEHTFYPTFTEGNKYKGINDYDPTCAFVVAVDYQWRISPMPVVQVNKLPGSQYKTINFIDALYVLHPFGLEDVVKTFCNKYDGHLNKVVHFIYDHTAIGRNPAKMVFRDIVKKAFRYNGWVVIDHYTGDAPDQDIKFENIKLWLVNRGEYAVKVNEIAAEQMIKSIEQSPAKTVNGVTKKDKKSEGDLNFPAEDSTHFGDAFDQILWGLLEHNIKAKLNNTTGIPIKVG
jgi:hypothetical protein